MPHGPRLLGPRLLRSGPRLLETAALGPRLLGPRLLRTQTRQIHMAGPRLLETAALGPRLLGPRLLKISSGPRLLETAAFGPRLLGPCLLKTQTRQIHMAGPRLLETAAFGPRLLGPRLLKTATGPRRLETAAFGPRLLGPRLLKTGTRQLHMTGAATLPSRFLTSEKLVSKPAEKQQQQQIKPENHRHFNTSRNLKAVNDTSTIDFAYLPDSSILNYDLPTPAMRVPILPLAFFPPRTEDYDNNVGDVEIAVHRPIISTASSDVAHVSSPSAVADMSVEGGMKEFGVVEEKVMGLVEVMAEGLNLSKEQRDEAIVKAQGVMRKAWMGLMEDVFGSKGTKA